MGINHSMRQETAETEALKVLTWLVAQDDLFGTFLAATGASAADVAVGAADAAFLGAVLDFLLQQDDWVLAYAQDTGTKPGLPLLARAYLPGGEAWHWT
jgi:Protein of unknown function (DUF3572)